MAFQADPRRHGSVRLLAQWSMADSPLRRSRSTNRRARTAAPRMAACGASPCGWPPYRKEI